MKINLLDYDNKKTPVEIPDDTEFIIGVVVTGDMIMVYPKFVDSSDNRIDDYFEGAFRIEKKDFNILDNPDITSYDILNTYPDIK